MHPNDENAERLGLKDPGKTEAWYIVKADENAFAYTGTLPGMTPEKFRDAIERGDNYDGVMKKVATTTDETYFVPPGRLHGLDAGNLAFEIQQNSDAGFAWDWAGFVEAGVIPVEEAREHKKNAVECAFYEDGLQEQTKYVTIDERGTERTFCAACKYFVLERWTSSTGFDFEDGAARFNTWTLIGGKATFAGNNESVEAKRGESLLIPAGLKTRIEPLGARRSSCCAATFPIWNWMSSKSCVRATSPTNRSRGWEVTARATIYCPCWACRKAFSTRKEAV